MILALPLDNCAPLRKAAGFSCYRSTLKNMFWSPVCLTFEKKKLLGKQQELYLYSSGFIKIYIGHSFFFFYNNHILLYKSP